MSTWSFWNMFAVPTVISEAEERLVYPPLPHPRPLVMDTKKYHNDDVCEILQISERAKYRYMLMRTFLGSVDDRECRDRNCRFRKIVDRARAMARALLARFPDPFVIPVNVQRHIEQGLDFEAQMLIHFKTHETCCQISSASRWVDWFDAWCEDAVLLLSPPNKAE